MVRDGRWKLVRAPMADGSEQWSLFDLSRDPQCLTDVYRSEPGTATRLKPELLAWMAGERRRPVTETESPAAPAPLAIVADPVRSVG
jgi:hypothetical protein